MPRKPSEKPVTRRVKTTDDEAKPTPQTRSPLDVLSSMKISIKYKNEAQKRFTQSISVNDVTLCTGPAGSGKTFLAVAEALKLLKENQNKYGSITLVKSIIQLRGEDVGTVPGDENEKMRSIMMSFLDAFYDLIGEKLTTQLLDAGIIKLNVFGAIRGRSLKNTILLVDEFQNITRDNAKTFLTRFSDNTKVVVMGDTGQIDLVNKANSSLEYTANKMKKAPIEGVGIIEFTEDDIVRHRLTSYFINIFKEEPVKIKPMVVVPFTKKKSRWVRFLELFSF